MYSSIPNSTKRSQLIYNLFKKSSIYFWDIKIFSTLSLNFQHHLEGGFSFSHLLTPPAFSLRENWITVVAMKCVALHGADPGRRLTAGSVWGRMTFADRGKKVTPPIKSASKRRPWVSWICSRLGESQLLVETFPMLGSLRIGLESALRVRLKFNKWHFSFSYFSKLP